LIQALRSRDRRSTAEWSEASDGGRTRASQRIRIDDHLASVVPEAHSTMTLETAASTNSRMTSAQTADRRHDTNPVAHPLLDKCLDVHLRPAHPTRTLGGDRKPRARTNMANFDTCGQPLADWRRCGSSMGSRPQRRVWFDDESSGRLQPGGPMPSSSRSFGAARLGAFALATAVFACSFVAPATQRPLASSRVMSTGRRRRTLGGAGVEAVRRVPSRQENYQDPRGFLRHYASIGELWDVNKTCVAHRNGKVLVDGRCRTTSTGRT